MIQDFRLAVRKLFHAPGFTLAAVITLALGIGANTAIFSLVYGVLLRPFPYRDAGELMKVWATDLHNDEERANFSFPDFEDFDRQQRSFEGLAPYTGGSRNLTEAQAAPERIDSALISHRLLPLLGVRPALGREILPSDDRAGAPPVVLLGDRLWQRRFGGDPAVIGRRILLDGTPHTVIGVMPPEFRFPRENFDVWLPLEPNNQTFRSERGVHNLGVIGRLAPGVTVEQATAEMTAIASRLEKQYPEDNVGRGAFVETLREATTGRVRRMLLLLLGAVTMVLLIACANVAGLMLVRATAAGREMAIRQTLGATRWRLARQLLAESLLVSFTGALAGIAVAAGGIRAVLALAPESLPRRAEIVLNLPVMFFAIACGIACGLLFGLIPAARALRGRMAGELRAAGTAASTSPLRRSFRSILVGAEVAIAVVLTIGAGLLARSFWSVMNVDPGFRHRDVVKFDIQLPESSYPEPSRDVYPRWPEVVRFYDTLLDRLSEIPGVASASLALNHPLSEGWTTRVGVTGAPPKSGPLDESHLRPVAPGYFATIGTPVLSGRDVAATDKSDKPLVVLLNQAFANKYFPGTDPVGRSVDMWGRSWTVIGVVADVRYMGLQQPAAPAVYPSIRQTPMANFSVLIRGERNTAAVLPAVRSAVWSIDSSVALVDVDTLGNLVEDAAGPQELNATLVGSFGVLALLLAGIGIYGVISYQTQLRRQEFGVRLALGADGMQLLRSVLLQGALLTGAGLAVGLAASVGATRLLRTMLFEVSPLDLSTFALAAAALGVIAVVACWFPARRAARLDPVTVLRSE